MAPSASANPRLSHRFLYGPQHVLSRSHFDEPPLTLNDTKLALVCTPPGTANFNSFAFPIDTPVPHDKIEVSLRKRRPVTLRVGIMSAAWGAFAHLPAW